MTGIPTQLDLELTNDTRALFLVPRPAVGTWMIELQQKYRSSPYVGIWVFWRRGLVINDPELARKILVKDADVFRNRMLASGKSDPMGALNLFTVDDPLWTSIRRRLTSVFTGSKLRGWQELYQAKVEDLIYRINSDNEKGIVIELRPLFADYATDIIGESSFGIQCQSTRDSTGPLRLMTKEFEKYNHWRGMAWSSIFFLPEMVDIFRFSFWPKNTVAYFRKVFKAMVEERGGFEKDIDGKRDLLDALLKMKIDAKKENQDMDLDILISNAMIFLQGGYDTSSSTLTYTVYELAYNPKYQKILYDELVEAEKALDGKRFDAESLAKLPYLDAVIKGKLFILSKRIGMNTVRYALAAVVLNFEIFPMDKFPLPNDIPIEKKGLFYLPAVPLSVEFRRRKYN
ncbi:hypothetical protein HF086_008450 [Spodoptera exigua]|uniref:unspecific monooxygenase n=1 Tax=Spodoptera exigua TaxID=7107 RepID=A0A922MNX9_SPOEX|nr:hypothetical protein HF086_008450 [Spodoptera exigua]